MRRKKTGQSREMQLSKWAESEFLVQLWHNCKLEEEGGREGRGGKEG